MTNNYTYEEGPKMDNTNTSLITDNSGYGDANFLQYRLNTDPLLADLELYLRGVRTRVELDDSGTPRVLKEDFGRRKTNELGVQSIMAWVQAMINPMVVQGNLDEDGYRAYLRRQRRSLAKYLMVNINRFQISEDEYGGIIGTIFASVELFITRPINNQERKTLMPGAHRFSDGFGNQNQMMPVQKKKGLGGLF